MTCLSHEDCSAGVVVHQAGTKFSIVYTSAAHSGSNIIQQPVPEERLELAKTGGYVTMKKKKSEQGNF